LSKARHKASSLYSGDGSSFAGSGHDSRAGYAATTAPRLAPGPHGRVVHRAVGLAASGVRKAAPGEVGLDFEAASVNVEGSGWKSAAKAALDHRCASRPRVTTGRDGEMVSAKQRDATG